ncbi:hypothetical protein [Kribbella deserti]|uniref:DUF4240 domain-containing protein n=1 Tax=Kribbella deserti TaxID=1926257 RepID=A0ABV6QWS9_9ACTN
MTKLFMATDDDRVVWVLALIDEDVWSYVVNTGKFHRNEGLRHDYFFTSDYSYTEIGVGEATRLIAENVGLVDEESSADVLANWQDDDSALSPETVFAASVADLN